MQVSRWPKKNRSIENHMQSSTPACVICALSYTLHSVVIHLASAKSVSTPSVTWLSIYTVIYTTSASFSPVILIPAWTQRICSSTLPVICVARCRPSIPSTSTLEPIITPAKGSAGMSSLIRLRAVQQGVLVFLLIAAVIGVARDRVYRVAVLLWARGFDFGGPCVVDVAFS